MMRAYEEIIDFIAAGTTPNSVVAFQPSEEAKGRVADFIHRENRILDFNNEERLFERQTLHTIGRYPSVAAVERMRRRP
jgi:hypothetical protein